MKVSSNACQCLYYYQRPDLLSVSMLQVVNCALFLSSTGKAKDAAQTEYVAFVEELKGKYS